ncbi:cytochrome P450 [Neolentinus lepideus HHB14362 ss-1]|uniref:Cytochrome P450 n=1 Tax=Neolentinus lepideus HHB14362 ss-1 TaxID=1314782 RepID=A0A165T2M0_9AGAM|nr:cytochrome P450 [Neolentinus lepideus HHB14362 ss-1]
MSILLSVSALFLAPSQCLLLVTLIAISICVRRLLDSACGKPLPPGPTGNWLLGNALPRYFAHRQFDEWTRQYGPIFTLRQGRNITIVIGRYQAAVDILEKQGAATADRPRHVSANEILSDGLRPALTRAGERLNKIRRVYHVFLQPKAIPALAPVQMKAAKSVILDLLDNPKQHKSHMERYAASVAMTMTYGKTTPTSYSDPAVRQVLKCLHRSATLIKPGGHPVDSYPLLRFIPGYLRTIRKWRDEERALYLTQLDTVRKQMETHEAQPCLAKFLLERQEEFSFDEIDLAYITGVLFGAASDTTSSALSISIMTAATNPSAQEIVRQELDQVIGPERRRRHSLSRREST